MEAARTAAAIVAACVAIPVGAQTVTLVCTPGQGQPPQLSIELDYSRNVVHHPVRDLAMRVSDQSIEWNSPARRDAAGIVTAPGFFQLDRMTGRLFRQHDCPNCGPLPPLYCAPGTKLF